MGLGSLFSPVYKPEKSSKSMKKSSKKPLKRQHSSRSGGDGGRRSTRSSNKTNKSIRKKDKKVNIEYSVANFDNFYKTFRWQKFAKLPSLVTLQHAVFVFVSRFYLTANLSDKKVQSKWNITDCVA